jgi:hypothetical protein
MIHISAIVYNLVFVSGVLSVNFLCAEGKFLKLVPKMVPPLRVHHVE